VWIIFFKKGGGMKRDHVKDCEIILTCKCGAKIKIPTKLYEDGLKILYVKAVEEKVVCPGCKKPRTVAGMTRHSDLFSIYDL
jgi:hypothetical protein